MKALPFSRSAFAAALAATFFCGTATAATPVSPEFRVNTFTNKNQWGSSVAMDADGDFVLSWTSYGQDGSYDGVYARRYNAARVAQGSEFRVNTFTKGSQDQSSVAMDADGDFVIAWTGGKQDGKQDDNYGGVYAQRYNALGVAQGGEFRVNTYTPHTQTGASVAMDADGDFVVTWDSFKQDGSNSGIYAQRFNAAGVPQGGEFRVNTFKSGAQRFSSVAMDADGDFVISWQSPQDGDGYGIYARRYNAAGVARGGEFRVNTTTPLNQTSPSIAMDAQGDFVVSWDSLEQDGSGFGIYARRYDAAGVARGGEFRVNAVTSNHQRNPSVAMDALGDFVVSWESFEQDSSRYGVYAQRYDAAGAAQGSEFRANTFTNSAQAYPSVAMDADGDFLVSWSSYSQDGSGYGVYARRYQGPASVDLTLTQFDSADPVSRRGQLSYTLTASNLNAPSSGLTGIAAIDAAIGAASQLRVTSTLPAGSGFASTAGNGWSCRLTSPTLTCRQGRTLAAGASAPPLTINLTAPNKTGMIRHDAQVSGAQHDPLPSNNRDIETTQVINAAP